MFTKNYVISNNDVDSNFELKVSAIFRLFQDVAMLATKDLKVDSMSFSVSDKEISWIKHCHIFAWISENTYLFITLRQTFDIHHHASDDPVDISLT